MDEISRTFIDGNGFGGMSGAGLGAGFIGGSAQLIIRSLPR